MDAIKLLEKAYLADKLGNYKLADTIYNRAVRIAAGEMGFVDVIIKGLEKAGVEAGEAATLEAMQKIFVESLEKAMAEGAGAAEKAELQALIKEVEPELAAKIMRTVESGEAAAFTREEISQAAEQLLQKANSSEAVLNRVLTETPKPSVPEVNVSKPSLVDKTKADIEKVTGNIQQRIQSFMAKKPNAKKILLGLGVVATTVGGVIYFTRPNGERLSDEEANSIIDAAENSDPYKNMYEERMKAGQQQRQNEAAQKFVDENKSKFTSQRAFYDAALAAGDKNFANDVIAIVKKDTPELPREPVK